MKNLIQTESIGSIGTAENTKKTEYKTIAFLTPKDILVQVMLTTVCYQQYPATLMRGKISAGIGSYDYMEAGIKKTKTFGEFDADNNLEIKKCTSVTIRLIYENGHGSAIINIYQKSPQLRMITR